MMRWINLVGSILLLAALLEGLLLNETIGNWMVSTGLELEQPGLIVLIAHGFLCMALALVQKKYATGEVVSTDPFPGSCQVLAICGLVTSGIAFPLAHVVTDGTFFTHGLEVLAISFTWLLGSLALAWTAYFIAVVSPGPATLAIAGTAMGHGRRQAVALANGVLTGSFFWAQASGSSSKKPTTRRTRATLNTAVNILQQFSTI